MSWLYQKQKYHSEKNGEVTLERFLGEWRVFSGVWDQTTPYTNRMWASALEKLPSDFVPKNVLVFGLGGGGIAKIILKQFSKTNITFIEWDEIMVTIAKQILPIKILNKIQIIKDEANHALQTIPNTFDLIIIDLFSGQNVADVVSEEQFISNIANKISNNGLLLANLFAQPEKSLSIKKHFNELKNWQHLYNNLALYSPKNVPEDYAIFRASKEFTLRDTKSGVFRSVQAGKTHGKLREFSWLNILRFDGDEEPIVQPIDKLQLVIWQPTTLKEKVKNWRRMFFRIGTKRSGFATIITPEYWQAWDPAAQRQRKRWLKEKNNTWEIYTPTLEEFITEYKKNKLSWIVKSEFIKILRNKIQNHKDLVNIYGARRITKDEQGNIISRGILAAGFVGVDIPEVKQAYHMISFHNEDAKKNAVGTGLIDEWFADSTKKNFKYLDFCVFWAPHEDKKWQGFSRFKSQFGVTFINYPKPLFKWVRAKK